MKKCLLNALLMSCLISSQAQSFLYNVNFSGANESPSNGSPGTGLGTVLYDSLAHTLALNLSFAGLTGSTTASHIHAATASPFTGTAGVATTTPTFAGFPLGVTSGSFANTLDLTLATSYNASFITANGGTTASAEVALAGAMANGKAYWNIHTSTFGGGEIRGFLTPVPEPGTLALITLGGLGGAARIWNKRRASRKV